MTATASRSSLVLYNLRRVPMYSPLLQSSGPPPGPARQLQAEADVRARRLLAVRRSQCELERANHQVRLARLSIR
jgi:hypothetical protein